MESDWSETGNQQRTTSNQNMKDESFIQSILQKGKDAAEKVTSNFSSISETQLNWKRSSQSWNIAQCLQHLMISHLAYFPVLNQIIEGEFKMNFWERNSPFSRFWGREMKERLQEKVKGRLIAPRKIQPTKTEYHIVLLDRYQENLEEFLNRISQCKDVDLDKTIITSPLLSIVTYSLRDAFQFLLQHEHRHINQAIRVKESESFPN